MSSINDKSYCPKETKHQNDWMNDSVITSLQRNSPSMHLQLEGLTHRSRRSRFLRVNRRDVWDVQIETQHAQELHQVCCRDGNDQEHTGLIFPTSPWSWTDSVGTSCSCSVRLFLGGCCIYFNNKSFGGINLPCLSVGRGVFSCCWWRRDVFTN